MIMKIGVPIDQIKQHRREIPLKEFILLKD